MIVLEVAALLAGLVVVALIHELDVAGVESEEAGRWAPLPASENDERCTPSIAQS